MIDFEPRLALTFDDISLVPGLSESHPNDVELRTRVCRGIDMNIPILSSAMDTVTESRLAIALAQQGGIGVIHKNLPVERQAEEVDKVKRSESGMIVDPVTIRPDRPVSEALTKQPLVTVPVGTTLEQAKAVLQKHRIEKLLVIDGDKHIKGLITVKDIQKAIKYPTAAKDALGRLRVAAAIGATGDFRERADELVRARVDCLVVDTAHGHSTRVIEAVREIKRRYGDTQLIAGNVATTEATRELIDAGVDAVKVGIGPGSICTTRVVTGAGVPQITAIQECVEAAKNSGVPLISDGGVKFSGDVAKAIAAGADVVMIGSLFAGTEEAPGEVILFQGRSFKTYRGMGSIGAMREGSRDRYAQDTIETDSKLVPEGIEGRVPYKGTLAEMVTQLVGGLRSGMGYTGCRTIPEFQERTRFLRITSAGLKESHVHDVIITKEAPNYRLE